jgi:hypothetical protein
MRIDSSMHHFIRELISPLPVGRKPRSNSVLSGGVGCRQTFLKCIQIPKEPVCFVLAKVRMVTIVDRGGAQNMGSM